MPLGTLDSQPPPFFRQGPSAQSKLAVYSALALFLMVADARFGIMQPLRAALATVLYPVQWVAMAPIRVAGIAGSYMESLTAAQEKEARAHYQLASMSARANQVEQLTLENERLRKLLDLRARTQAPSMAAQVLYDAADPYTRQLAHFDAVIEGREAPLCDALDGLRTLAATLAVRDAADTGQAVDLSATNRAGDGT